MFTVLISIHCFLSVFMIVLVLMQQGKGADLGATLSGGSNTVFGAAGAADMLTKLTTGTAVAFMLTSVLLVRNYNTAGAIGTSADIMEGSLFTEEDDAVVKPEVADFENIPTEEDASQEGETASAAKVASTEESAADASAEAAPAEEEASVGEEVVVGEGEALAADEGQAAAAAVAAIETESSEVVVMEDAAEGVSEEVQAEEATLE